jgi:hypothetical protein
MSFNPSTSQYELIADGGYIVNATESHRGGMPYGNYSFNVSCYNDLGYDNLSIVSDVNVSLYDTSIVVENGTDSPSQGENVYFYANYSSDLMPVSGVGLEGYEIGAVVWNTSDLGVASYSVAYFDCENKGEKDCVAVGEDGEIFIFYSNGTLKGSVSTQSSDAAILEIEAFDGDNDGYENEITIADYIGYANVINETVDLVWTNNQDLYIILSVAVGDLDNDGLKDDFVTVGNSGGGNSIYYWNTSDGITWFNMWNLTNTNNLDSIAVAVGDLDRDGFEDDSVIFGSGSSQDSDFKTFNESGGNIWNSSNTLYPDAVAVADIDHDGYRDEVVALRHRYLDIYKWNGTYGVAPTTLWEIDHSNNIYGGKVAVGDLDNDGFVDDIVYAKTNVFAVNNNSDALWNFTGASSSINSIRIKDINNDGEDEVLIGGEDDTLWILNRTGGLIFSYNIGLGDIGYENSENNYGNNPAIDASDINNDGINDIAVSSQEGYAHILQDVNCIASFNDSANYNMTWNSTLNKWEMNRTFGIGGTYDWNTTCSKGGYETSLGSDTVSIAFDVTAPIVSLVLPVNNSKESGLEAINFTYNVTDVAPISNCSLIIDGVVNLTNLSITKDVDQIFTQTLADGDYDWNVNCTDVANNVGASEIFNVSVSTDYEYPIFSNYWDNNASLTGSGIGLFNVTINLTNGTVFLAIDGVNYTATNLTSDVYNVSVNFISFGTLDYYWGSWGNGTNENYNTSGLRSYTINLSALEINFANPTPSNGFTQAETNVEINVSIINVSDLNEVIFNWNSTNYSIFDDSLVLMMNFDNVSLLGENDSLVVDVSGYGNNGIVSGGAVVNSSGRYGGGFEFDGNIDSSIIISNNLTLNITSYIALEVWVKPSIVSLAYQYIITKGSTESTERVYGLMIENSDIRFFINGWDSGDGSDVIALSSVSVDTWYHLVGVYNGSELMIYKNGELVINSSYSGAIDTNNVDVHISCRDNAGSFNYCFNGSVDEVRIWNRSLSASEVQQLYFTNLNKYDTDKWSLYVNQSKNTTAGLDEGTYTYQAFASDGTNWNQTEERSVTISANTLPTDPTPTLNSTEGSNRTLQDLNCFDVLDDVDNDTMNVSVRWYKDDILNLSVDYNNSYANGTSFDANLSSANTSKGESSRTNSGLLSNTTSSGALEARARRRLILLVLVDALLRIAGIFRV